MTTLFAATSGRRGGVHLERQQRDGFWGWWCRRGRGSHAVPDLLVTSPRCLRQLSPSPCRACFAFTYIGPSGLGEGRVDQQPESRSPAKDFVMKGEKKKKRRVFQCLACLFFWCECFLWRSRHDSCGSVLRYVYIKWINALQEMVRSEMENWHVKEACVIVTVCVCVCTCTSVQWLIVYKDDSW